MRGGMLLEEIQYATGGFDKRRTSSVKNKNGNVAFSERIPYPLSPLCHPIITSR